MRRLWHKCLNRTEKGAEVLFDFFFPPKCAACDTLISPEQPSGFCDTCFKDIHWIKEPICHICGMGFATIEDQDENLETDSPASCELEAGKTMKSHLCGDCIKKTYSFDKARSATFYRGKIREAIKRFKFSNMSELSRFLSGILTKSEIVIDSTRETDTVVPVPLHKKRLRDRGYNQALLLSRELSRTLNLDLEEHNLRRIKHTLPQVGLGKKERLKNVKGAFEVNRPEKINGKRILLVDDVFTTGNTLSECARVLKKAGALKVVAVTVARVSATDFDF